MPTIWTNSASPASITVLPSKLVNPHGNHPGLGKEAFAEEDRRPGEPSIGQPGNQGRRADQAAGGPRRRRSRPSSTWQRWDADATRRRSTSRRWLTALDTHRRSPLGGPPGPVPGGRQSLHQCDGTCCNAETMNKLQEHATAKNASGCYKEPSAEVRAMAQAARTPAGASCRRAMPRRRQPRRRAPASTRSCRYRPAASIRRACRRPRRCRRSRRRCPRPATEPKKPLEVPAEPPKASAAPTRGVPTPATPVSAAPASAPHEASYVAIVDVKPVNYVARKALRPRPGTARCRAACRAPS